jgi:dolichol-phosphate mannosyltransferase
MCEISVVTPVYGCEHSLRTLHARLVTVLASTSETYEVIYVDDRSPDGAWETLRELTAADPNARAIRLSRNFGQHVAITAGLAAARGQWTVVMDCDLQDPPEMIPRLLEEARRGHDIVFARRTGRRLSPAYRLAARAYHFLLRRLTGVDIDGNVGNLSLITAQVRREFLRFGEKDRHYLLILTWLGFSTSTVEYEQPTRAAGETSYRVSSLVRHALIGLSFQTSVLLTWIVGVGFAIASAGVALAALLIAWYFVVTPPSGYTSLAVLILTLSGFIVVSLGVSALYVGRIFTETKNRPLYVIDEALGHDGE